VEGRERKEREEGRRKGEGWERGKEGRGGEGDERKGIGWEGEGVRLERDKGTRGKECRAMGGGGRWEEEMSDGVLNIQSLACKHVSAFKCSSIRQSMHT